MRRNGKIENTQRVGGKTAERIWPCRCFFIFAAAAATPATAMGALSLVCGKHFLPVLVSKCYPLPPLLLFTPFPCLVLLLAALNVFHTFRLQFSEHLSLSVHDLCCLAALQTLPKRHILLHCSYSLSLTLCQPVPHLVELVGNAKTELANRKSHKKCTCQSSSQH